MELLLSASELTDWYYKNVVGYYPWKTENNRQITELTIQYLIDSHIRQQIIVNNIFNDCPNGIIAPQILPDYLWEGSLITRNTFYTHRAFQLISPTATYEEVFSNRVMEDIRKFWIEIIPQFTMKNLIDYFYAQFWDAPELRTEKQDIGAFTYLLNRYQDKSPYVQSLDLIMVAIDDMSNEDTYITDPIEIQDYADKIFHELERKNTLGYEQGACRIIWRSEHIPEETGDIYITGAIDPVLSL